MCASERGQFPEHAGAQVRALTGALQPAYWQALIVVSLLYFARFDASFITLRAKLVPPAATGMCWGLGCV